MITRNSIFLMFFSLVITSFLCAQPAYAVPGGGDEGGEETQEAEDEILSRTEVSSDITADSIDLLGEQIDLSTGTLNFRHVDINLKGNSPLQVALVRTHSNGTFYRHSQHDMADWEIEIPYISTVVSSQDGWRSNRCSYQTYEPDPVVTEFNGVFEPHDFWSGINIQIPGYGVQKLLESYGSFVPPAYPAGVTGGTKENLIASCITFNDGSQEGFKVNTPDGVTYFFDVMTTRPAQAAIKYEDGKKILPRMEVILHASRAEDINGNWVRYFYNGNGQLTGIKANDGREILLTYRAAGDYLETVSADGKTWRYDYTQSGDYTYLTKVTLPEGLQWHFALQEIAKAQPNPMDLIQHVGTEFEDDNRKIVTGSITHPHGVKGTYTIRETIHGRTKVPFHPSQPYKKTYDVLSIASKTLTGGGIDTLVWHYTYSEQDGGWDTESTSDFKTTTVAGPEGNKTVYTYKRTFDWEEDALVREDIYRKYSSQILRSVENQWLQGPRMGATFGPGENGERLIYARRLDKRTVTENGNVYYTDYDYDDDPGAATFSYGEPTAVHRWNNFSSNDRQEVIGYRHDIAAWQIGLLQTRTVNGLLAEENLYDSLNQVKEVKRFGKRVATYGYHADGLLHWQKDGRGNQTSYSDYKRGIPRTITRPDNRAISAVVNNDGSLASKTDGRGFTTRYEYDDLGRITGITPPQNDNVLWLPTVIRYESVDGSDTALPGIVEGHWKQTVSRGNYRKTVFLDGLSRALLVREEDIADSGKARYGRTEYDAFGQPTFTALPSTAANDTVGIRIAYDALGRQIKLINTADNSETKWDYLAGNKKRVTDARGRQTTYAYQAFGAPAYETVTRIDAPEAVTTIIQRDNFGKITQVTQSGPYNGQTVSATRSYFYDTYQQLCKRVDPEVGNSVFDYDAAGNLVWSATGAPGSSRSCDHGAVPQAERTVYRYDSYNRMVGKDFPAGTSDIGYGYDHSGNLENLTTAETSWTYRYNGLNQLDSETLSTDGRRFAIGYEYNAEGALKNITYPGGRAIDLRPDAFGAPSRAGAYATHADYYADGQLAGFTYGNGQRYTLLRNNRHLPETIRASDATRVMDLTYHYDAVLNIESITDAVNSGRNKVLAYDDLDRLETATGPWGTASYRYDPLGNLRSKTLGGQNLTYHYDMVKNRLASISGSLSYNFSYDSQGNVSANGQDTFIYDKANRLVQVPSQTNGVYTYDGHGRRVMKEGIGGRQISVYNQAGRLMHTYDPDTNQVSDYIYLTGQLVAKVRAAAGAPLDMPVITSPAANVTGAFTVGWSAVPTADDYRLEQQKNGGAWTILGNGNITGQSFALSGLSVGRYRFRVAGCNSHGCGPSKVASVRVTAPPVPASLTVPGSDTDGRYGISWSGVNGASHYALTENGNQIYTGANTSHSVSGRGNGNYTYAVQACSAAGCSAFSASRRITVALPPPVPGSITVPGTSSTGSYTISWASASTATAYQLLENGSQVYNGSGTSKAVSGKGDGSYTYKVKACNASGCSGYKTSSTVNVLHTPAVPSLSAPSTSSNGAYTVSWGGNGGSISRFEFWEQLAGGNWVLKSNNLSKSMSFSTMPEGKHNYRVQACNAYSCSAFASRTVTVDYPVPTVTASFTPKVVLWPEGSQFSWSSTNASRCKDETGRTLATSGSYWDEWSSNTSKTITCFNGPHSASFTANLVVKRSGGPK